MPTTTTAAPTTTTTIPADNEPPTVQITAPGALTAHVAAYDTDQEDFGAYLDLAATASDPNGDPVEVRWSASTQGFLGTGTSLTAWFSTRGSDATQPVITATAVDRWGTSTSRIHPGDRLDTVRHLNLADPPRSRKRKCEPPGAS